jgi:hypothetical protein
MAGQQLPADLVAWLRDLDRRLATLERSPQLTSASIKDGALTIYNAAGLPVLVLGKQSTGRYGLSAFNAAGQRTLELGELASSRNGLEVPDPTTGVAQIRVGQLAAGGYGLEAISGGQPVTLDKLAFGIQAARIDTSETHVAGGGFADLPTVGPSVTVNVGAAGRLLVQVTCGISGGSGGQGKAGFDISGATTVAPSANSAVIVGGAVGVAEVGQVGATYLVTGLNPGSHTIKMMYASTGTTMTYFARTIAVQPF